MWDPPADHPLRRMFAGLAEHAFLSRLGVADPPLVDYLSTLLSRFVHFDTLHPVRDPRGRPLTDLAGMVAATLDLPAGGRTQRDLFRHVGDFALFWTGLYPEALERNRHRGRADGVVGYTAQGKRGYYLASTFDDDAGEGPVLRRLSEQFELCAVGLREVRREWEASAPPPGCGRLIR